MNFVESMVAVEKKYWRIDEFFVLARGPAVVTLLDGTASSRVGRSRIRSVTRRAVPQTALTEKNKSSGQYTIPYDNFVCGVHEYSHSTCHETCVSERREKRSEPVSQ